MMPEMDGFEVCARLKDSERTRDAAVIFLSARTESKDKVRGSNSWRRLHHQAVPGR
jgi:putative two-component system response regulator